MKAHVCYFDLKAWLLIYLYSLRPDFYTLENIINIGNFFNNEQKILKLIISLYISYIDIDVENKLLIWKLDFKNFFSEHL